jgi:hypothetical protein
MEKMEKIRILVEIIIGEKNDKLLIKLALI